MTHEEIWLSPALKGHIELMTHLCQSADNTLLIIGPENAGKTTLYRHFCFQSIRGCQVAGLTAQPWECVESFMEAIAKALSLPLSDSLTAFQTVKNFIENRSPKEPAIVLLIDDAHLLNDEFLQALYALFKYDAHASMPLQLILFGEASLELRLFSPQISAMMNGKIYTLELEPWSLQEVRQFLCKAKALALLPMDQIQEIYEKTQGLPGLVATHREALLKQVKKEDGMFLQSLTKWRKNPIVLGVLIGVLGGGSYIVFNRTQSDTVLGQIPAGMVQQEESGRGVQVIVADQTALDQEHEKQIAYPVQTNYQPENESEEMSLVVEESQSEAVPLAEIDAPLAHNEPEVTESAVVELSQAEDTDMNEAVAETAPETVVETSIPMEPVITLSEEMPVKKGQVLTEEETYLLSLDSNRYTLQLVGARNENNVKHFMTQHGLEYQASYFKTKLSGKDWFVVVLGDFATEQEAKEAVSLLPASLANAPLQPWVRKISAIQADIQKADHT